MELISPITPESAAATGATRQVESLSRQIRSAEDLAGREKAEKYWQVAEGFEEIFLNLMMRSMRQTTMDSGFLGDSHASRMYRSMYDEQLAADMADRRGFGLSRMIFEWLTRGDTELRRFGVNPLEAVQRYRAVEQGDLEQVPANPPSNE